MLKTRMTLDGISQKVVLVLMDGWMVDRDGWIRKRRRLIDWGAMKRE